MSIKVDDLFSEVQEALNEYHADVIADVKKSVKSTAKVCVEELKRTSPKDSGDYAKGWRSGTAFESDRDIRMQIYNATDYQLTHLLEDGFAHVSGGHVDGKPHIDPAAERASELLEKDIKIKVGR